MHNIPRGLRWLFSSSIPRSFEPYWTMYMGVAIGWTSLEQRMTIFESTAISRPCGWNHELSYFYDALLSANYLLLHFLDSEGSSFFHRKCVGYVTYHQFGWHCAPGDDARSDERRSTRQSQKVQQISSMLQRLAHILSFVLEKYHTIPPIEVDDYVWTRISDFRTMTQRWYRQTPAKIVDFLGSRSWVEFIIESSMGSYLRPQQTCSQVIWIHHEISNTKGLGRLRECVAQFRLLRALVFQIYCLSKLHTLEHQINKYRANKFWTASSIITESISSATHHRQLKCARAPGTRLTSCQFRHRTWPWA